MANFPTVYYDDDGNAIAGPSIEAETLKEANAKLRLLAAYDPSDGMPADAIETFKIRHGGLPGMDRYRVKAAEDIGAGVAYHASTEFFRPAFQEEE